MYSLKVFTRSISTCALLVFAVSLAVITTSAQVVPSADRGGDRLWLDAEYSNINASFPYQSNQRLSGIGAFADFNWNTHLGVEADARFMPFGGFYGETESSYLAGPKFYYSRLGKFQPYAKGLIGVGRIHYPFDIGDATYLSIAPGAGTNYRIGHNWSLRGEYEYQMWLDSPGYANEPAHQIRPNGFQVGFAYRLLR